MKSAMLEGVFGPIRNLLTPVWSPRNVFWHELASALSGFSIPPQLSRRCAPANPPGSKGSVPYTQIDDSARFLGLLDKFANDLDVSIHVLFTNTLGQWSEFLAGSLGRSSPLILIVDLSIAINEDRGLVALPFDFAGGAYGPKDFFVTSFNSNGLSPEKVFDLVNSVALVRPPHSELVLLLQETHASEACPQGYERASLPGTSHSGGVSILLRRGLLFESTRFSFTARARQPGPSPDTQAISASISTASGQVSAVFISVYLRPGIAVPALAFDESLDEFRRWLSTLVPADATPVIVGGDFNIDPARDAGPWVKLSNMFATLGLTPLASPGPTYRRAGTSSTLDHIFTNQPAVCRPLGVIPRPSDHSPIYTGFGVTRAPMFKERPKVPHADTRFLRKLPTDTREATESRIARDLERTLEAQGLFRPASLDLPGVTAFAEALVRSVFIAASASIPVSFPRDAPAPARPGLQDAPPAPTPFRPPAGYPPFWNADLHDLHGRLHAAKLRLARRTPAGRNRFNIRHRLRTLVFRLDTRFSRLHEELRQAFVDSRPDALAAESLRSKHGITNFRPHLSGAILPPAASHASVSVDFVSRPLPDDRARWASVMAYMDAPPNADSVDYFSTSGDAPISDQDLVTAASRMNDDACPGTDGLDAYLLKVALGSQRWREAVRTLVSTCTSLALWPTCFSDLWLTTIFKGKGLDPSAPSSFRRICVGPRFAAFCESVILVKLTEAPGFSTDLAFGPSQSGFIRGSGPLSESVVIQMLLDNARRTRNPAAILALDQSAAFDRVEFLATVEGLVRAKATPASVRFVCAFLGVEGFGGTPRLLTVPNSGLRPVPLLCGNPQGGSLSPTLFLMSQNHVDASVPHGTGIQLPQFHPLVPPPPPLPLFRFADDTIAAAEKLKYDHNSLSLICNGPRGPATPLGAVSAGQGILHAMASSGGVVNPSKSQLFVSDGPYDHRLARDKSLPLRSGEVLTATSPLEALGVTYANTNATRTLVHPDPRGMRRMVEGFGGALGDFEFPVHARRDLLFSVVIPSTTYGTYICDSRTLPGNLESALTTGLRTITGTPASSYPTDLKDYRYLVPDDLLRDFLGCRTMSVHLGYHAALACLQAVRSPVAMLRTAASHELLRAWVDPAVNPLTFADKVIEFFQHLDPHPPATLAQRQALEMSPFMAGLLGSWDAAVALPPPHPPAPADPVRSLSDPFTRCDLYTDGSFLRGEINRGAFAVYFGPGDPRNYSQGVAEPGITNNRAELMGLLKALDIVKAELPPIGPCPVKYTIHTDSMYCRDICTVNRFIWSRNDWRTRAGLAPKNLEMVKELHARLTLLDSVVEVRWVRAHADDAGNNAADRLARDAAEALPVLAAAAPLPAPTFRPALPPYSTAKDALRRILSGKYSDGKLPKFVKALAPLHANAYLFFVAEITSYHDGTSGPGVRHERLCPWCNAGADTVSHLLVCPSPRGLVARSVVTGWPSVRDILANPPTPPRFPRVALAPRIGAAAHSLLNERRLALISRPPRGGSLTVRAAVFRPIAFGANPPVRWGAQLPWSAATLAGLFRTRGGDLLHAPALPGNNCLFVAVAVLLQESGVALGPLGDYARRLRHTVAAHVLDYPSSADPTRQPGRVRRVDAVDDRRRSREISESLRTDQPLDASPIPVISSVLGLSFEVIVIDPNAQVVAPHNVRFVSAAQGPQHAPAFAGTLVLLDDHWLPAAARI